MAYQLFFIYFYYLFSPPFCLDVDIHSYYFSGAFHDLPQRSGRDLECQPLPFTRTRNAFKDDVVCIGVHFQLIFLRVE